MTRTRLVAVALATSTVLLLGACGSDGDTTADGDAATPSTSTDSPAASAEPTSTAPTKTGKTLKPSATATTKEPAVKPGTYIDYEAVDEDGVTIARPSDAAKLTGAPADFKTYIGALIEKQSTAGVEGCTEAPRINVTQVDTGGWARGGYFIPGCGGSAALWAKSGGAWQQAWTGQSLVDCATLERYDFPSRLAGSTCDAGGESKPYSG
jgi:major membrane immunogen (membrane-anchored lipoprotein)